VVLFPGISGKDVTSGATDVFGKGGNGASTTPRLLPLCSTLRIGGRLVSGDPSATRDRLVCFWLVSKGTGSFSSWPLQFEVVFV
jgi:hypothetical protein